MKKHFFVAAVLVLLSSCGGSSTNSATDYSTAIAGAGSETGRLEISIASAPAASVSGKALESSQEVTANVEVSGQIVPLTGTYDTVTKGIVLSGGGYEFTGTTGDEGKISGSYSNPNGDGVFAGFDSSTNTVTVYCGTYESEECTDPGCSGVWDITVTSAELSSGTYMGNNGVGGILWGTVDGDTITGEDDEGSVITGTLSGNNVAGVWEIDGTTGTFEASTEGCN